MYPLSSDNMARLTVFCSIAYSSYLNEVPPLSCILQCYLVSSQGKWFYLFSFSKQVPYLLQFFDCSEHISHLFSMPEFHGIISVEMHSKVEAKYYCLFNICPHLFLSIFNFLYFIAPPNNPHDMCFNSQTSVEFHLAYLGAALSLFIRKVLFIQLLVYLTQKCLIQ